MYRVAVCTAFVLLSVGMPLRAMTRWLARQHAAQIGRLACKGIHRVLFITHRLNSESPSPFSGPFCADGSVGEFLRLVRDTSCLGGGAGMLVLAYY